MRTVHSFEILNGNRGPVTRKGLHGLIIAAAMLHKKQPGIKQNSRKCQYLSRSDH